MPVTFEEILRRADERRQREQAQRGNSENIPRNRPQFNHASSMPMPPSFAQARANIHNNPESQGNSGVRARSTTIRTSNGDIVSIINVGVTADHPNATTNAMPGISGLHGIQINGMQMPTPQFVFMHR